MAKNCLLVTLGTAFIKCPTNLILKLVICWVWEWESDCVLELDPDLDPDLDYPGISRLLFVHSSATIMMLTFCLRASIQVMSEGDAHDVGLAEVGYRTAQ